MHACLGHAIIICFLLTSTFKANRAINASGDHISALVSFRFLIHFDGYNHFISNMGGGISLLNSAMTVVGELLLDSNMATYGAGVSLDDICLVCDCCENPKFPIIIICSLPTLDYESCLYIHNSDS